MDSKKELPMNMVEQLLKFIPTNEERALLDDEAVIWIRFRELIASYMTFQSIRFLKL